MSTTTAPEAPPATPPAVTVPPRTTRDRWVLVVLGAVVAVDVGNLAEFLGEHGVPGVSFVLVLAAAAIVLADAVRRRHSTVVVAALVLYLAFLAVRAISVVGAANPALASGRVLDLLRDVVVVVVLVTLCVNYRGERVIAAAAVATAAVLSLLELLRQFVVGNEVTVGGLLRPASLVDVGLELPRHVGPVADFNFWGRILVLVAPFALSLAADRGEGRRRGIWFLAFVAIAGGIYLTGSRGAYLSLGVVVLTWMLVADRRYRRLLPLLPVLAVVAALVLPGVGARLASVVDTATTDSGEQDYSLTGRLSTLQIGWAIVQDHPWGGVGVGSYEAVYPEYQQRDGIDGPVLEAHNLYLQIAAESGIPALLVWLAFFGAAVLAAVRARCLWRWTGPPGESSGPVLLAAAAVASLVGWAVEGVVLHAENLHVFAVPLIIAVSLDVRARRTAVAVLGAPRWRTSMLVDVARRSPLDRPRPRFVLPAVVALVVLAVAVPVGGVVTRTWSATALVRVVPGAPGAGEDAYSAEVLSRRPLGSTYLRAVATPGARAAGERAGGPGEVAAVDVAIAQEPTLLLVTAQAADPGVATRTAEAVARAGVDDFARLGAYYTLRWEGTEEPRERRTLSTTRLAAIAVLALVAAGAVGVVRRRGAR